MAIKLATPCAVAVLYDTVLAFVAVVLCDAVAASVDEALSASSLAAVTGLYAVWFVVGVTATGRV